MKKRRMLLTSIIFMLFFLSACNKGKTVYTMDESIFIATALVRGDEQDVTVDVSEGTGDSENMIIPENTNEPVMENAEVQDSGGVTEGEDKPDTTPKPTVTPKAEATPKPAETPVATATPKPTEAPVATATPKPTEAPIVHTHSYSSSVTTAATCTTNGVKTYTCSCGDSYTESIASTGHHCVCDSETPATCQSEGYIYYVCDSCWNYSYSETIPKTAHSYGDYVTVTAATCETSGTMVSTCSGCGATETMTIPARGHSWSTSSYTLNGVKITEVKCSWWDCGVVQSRTEEPVE